MASTAIAQDLWRALWRGEPVAWHEADVVFLPFDALTTLVDHGQIETHWRTRLGEYRWKSDEWRRIASWDVPGARIVIAEVTVALEHRGHVERRTLTVTIAHSDAPPYALRHLGEATPAALLLVLAGYESEAERERD